MICATLIWVFAVICAIPDILSQLEHVTLDNNETITYCTPFPESVYGRKRYAKYMVVAKAMVYYIVPLCIISCFYVLMAKKLHESARDMPGEIQSGQSLAQGKSRRHVARMVLAFVIGN